MNITIEGRSVTKPSNTLMKGGANIAPVQSVDTDILLEIEKGNVKRLTPEELQLAINEDRFLRETTKEETILIEEKIEDKLNRLKSYHEAKIDNAANNAFIPNGMSNTNWKADVNRSKKVEKIKDELIQKINKSKTDEELNILIDSRLAAYESKDIEKIIENSLKNKERDQTFIKDFKLDPNLDDKQNKIAYDNFLEGQEKIKEAYRLLIEQKKEERINQLASQLIHRNNRIKKLEKYIFPWIVYICLKPIVGRKIAEHVGFFCYYFKITISMLITLLLLFILFAIGLTLYLVIQASLDAGHLVIGGVGNGMKTAVDKAAFRIFGKSIKLLGFLEGPANKVIKANNSFPFKAWELIILLIKPYLKGLL